MTTITLGTGTGYTGQLKAAQAIIRDFKAPTVRVDNLTVGGMVVHQLRRVNGEYFADVVGGKCGKTGRNQVNPRRITERAYHAMVAIAESCGLVSEVWAADGLFVLTLDHDTVSNWLAAKVPYTEAPANTAAYYGMGEGLDR